MKKKKDISIITINFNNGEYIRETIESVIAQTYFDKIEYIVIDGNSSDKSKDIIFEYKEFIDIFISENDKGIYDAMNKGIRLSNSDCIGILNGGDIYFDQFVIEKILNLFKKDKSLDIIYGDLLMTDINDFNIIKRKWISGYYNWFKFILYGWMPAHQSIFFKSQILGINKDNCYNIKLDIAADYDFCLRYIYKTKFNLHYINQFLVLMKEGGTSNKNIIQVAKSNFQVLKSWYDQKKIIPFWIFFSKPLMKISQLNFFDFKHKKFIRK